MSLKIKAKLLRVNKYGKGIFAIEDNSTLIDAASKALDCNLRANELLEDPVLYTLPFTETEFTASVVREKAQPSIGSICTVTIQVKKYDFISKLEHNAGTKITGVNLVVKNIVEL